jgi:hypothetical protein
MTHFDLVIRARKWLTGSQRCFPVFCESTSCREAPDAIGWNPHGSIVVECKVSVEDFLRDNYKYVGYKDPKWGYIFSSKGRARELKAKGYERVELLRMGKQRFFLCPPRLIIPEMLEKRNPDHGLLYVEGNHLKIVVKAPVRENADLDSEIRLLRLHWGQRMDEFPLIQAQSDALPKPEFLDTQLLELKDGFTVQ